MDALRALEARQLAAAGASAGQVKMVLPWLTL